MVSTQTDERILRSINYRLKITPASQLPRIVGHITSQLVSSGCSFSGSSTETTWLKTRISSLLADRSAEARFGAVVLIKTVLDVGGANIVVDDKDRFGTWIRGLLDVMKRPSGSLATTKCALLALTRVFMLTWDHPTLVRELTTPVLPTFIAACVQQAQSGGRPVYNELVDFVLESFALLLPRHPTIFRSFVAQIRAVALATLSCDPYGTDRATHVLVSAAPQQAKDAACHVLVLLHQCAQKGGGAAEWEKGLDELIVASHATLDQVFRAVMEDWQSVSGVRSTITAAEELPHEPYVETDEQSGFPSWRGLRSGVQRLQALLSLLQAYIYTPTAAPVKMPLGRIVDLLTRLLYVQVPQSNDAIGVRYNIQASREEREDLLSMLPAIHVLALELLVVLFERLGQASLPICAHFLDLLTWLFQAEEFDRDVRTAAYQCTGQLLSLIGPALDKSSVKSLEKIIRSCCADLLPSRTSSQQTASSDVISSQLTNGTKLGKAARTPMAASISTPQYGLAEKYPGLYDAAHELLPTLFCKLPATLVSKAMRTEMDRTAVLIGHSKALAESVLNPAPHKPSLLPILSALAPENPVTEAILRPRMPVILVKNHDTSTNMELVEQDIEDGGDVLQTEPTQASALNNSDLTGDQASKANGMDWTTMSKQQTKEPQANISWKRNADIDTQQNSEMPASTVVEGSTSTRFGHLGEQPMPMTASKRNGPEYDSEGEREQETTASSAKRIRLESAPVPGQPLDSAIEHAVPQVKVAHIQAAPDVSGEMTLLGSTDDEDDESDFEMPKLVFKSDVYEDEDEDED